MASYNETNIQTKCKTFELKRRPSLRSVNYPTSEFITGVAQQKVQELQMEADNNRETVKQMAGMQSKLLHYGEVLKENETLNKQVTSKIKSLELQGKRLQLNNKIKSLELQGKRLREVYKAASQEFRETVYLLFGYKVDRTNCMYKLASMYADGPDENLLFQSTEGQLNLIETDYSKVLKPLLDLHLGRHHSIPMLLSALTQELFQRQTMSMTNSTLSV
ncbi:mitotic spindle assembly checkpoint protein MAD1 [Diaphorina citri]|uniref:Mitotic spindle assembly checkpoint protein MAD1 n=1 Tax=Diaphorina citri TaxID=121845 RepID=A0A3Q0JAQ7_DIACI|nr:mitotic spindle assembly checkpoint protein MAD1 [Diaphorina citri]